MFSSWSNKYAHWVFFSSNFFRFFSTVLLCTWQKSTFLFNLRLHRFKVACSPFAPWYLTASSRSLVKGEQKAKWSMVLFATGFEPAPPDPRSGAQPLGTRTASYCVFLWIFVVGPKEGDKLDHVLVNICR